MKNWGCNYGLITVCVLVNSTILVRYCLPIMMKKCLYCSVNLLSHNPSCTSNKRNCYNIVNKIHKHYITVVDASRLRLSSKAFIAKAAPAFASDGCTKYNRRQKHVSSRVRCSVRQFPAKTSIFSLECLLRFPEFSLVQNSLQPKPNCLPLQNPEILYSYAALIYQTLKQLNW